MKIAFMGTPEPAALCLKTLIEAQEQIAVVVTQPDRKKGRGLEESPSPVKLLAQKYKIDVLSPKKIKDQFFIQKLKSYNPELIVVVAYGKILSKEILEIPKYGAINAHASLLPKYRGAAPIQRAILKGEAETGASIMYLNETLDTGDIILQEKVAIEKDDNAETLTEKLFRVGAQALLKAVLQIKTGTAKRIPQKESGATYAPKITKEAGEIDWRKPANEILSQVKALIPWPVAHTFYNDKMLKIWDADIAPKEKNAVPGEVSVEKEAVKVACGENALQLLVVQLEGGKKVGAADFARGHNLVSKKILPS